MPGGHSKVSISRDEAVAFYDFGRRLGKAKLRRQKKNWRG
jgi:hypothetical protein